MEWIGRDCMRAMLCARRGSSSSAEGVLSWDRLNSDIVSVQVLGARLASDHQEREHGHVLDGEHDPHVGGEPRSGFTSRFAAGSAVGAIVLVRLQTVWRPERLVLGALTALGGLMLLWPLASTLPVALALIAIAGFADGPNLSATFAVRQRWTPPELYGQVFTTALEDGRRPASVSRARPRRRRAASPERKAARTSP